MRTHWPGKQIFLMLLNTWLRLLKNEIGSNVGSPLLDQTCCGDIFLDCITSLHKSQMESTGKSPRDKGRLFNTFQHWFEDFLSSFAFIHSLIQHTFGEYLRCAVRCCRIWCWEKSWVYHIICFHPHNHFSLTCPHPKPQFLQNLPS